MRLATTFLIITVLGVLPLFAGERMQTMKIPTETVSDTAIYAPIVSQPQEQPEQFPLLALKTNLLFDAALMPNIEIEFPLNRRWSLAGEWIFPWWKSKDNSKALQILSGGLEGRYWTGKHESRSGLTGHFFGFYAGGGKYDLQNKGKGYQGEFYIATGISYGYALRLREALNMEFSLGIGYLITKYRHYKGEENNEILVWQNNGRYTWIGPTKAKISLVWMFYRKTRKGRNP